MKKLPSYLDDAARIRLLEQIGELVQQFGDDFGKKINNVKNVQGVDEVVENLAKAVQAADDAGIRGHKYVIEKGSDLIELGKKISFEIPNPSSASNEIVDIYNIADDVFMELKTVKNVNSWRSSIKPALTLALEQLDGIKALKHGAEASVRITESSSLTRSQIISALDNWLSTSALNPAKILTKVTIEGVGSPIVKVIS
jgi:hypothetical protein